MNMNAKGMSEVLTTVLLILLTIIVAAIVSAFVIKFSNNQLGKSSECFPYQDYFTFDDSLGYTCYVSDSRFMMSVSVHALAGKEDIAQNVEGFGLVFTEGPSSVVKNINGSASGFGRVGGVWKAENVSAPLDIVQPGEVTTYVYQGDKIYRKVKIYPVLRSGRACAVSDEITLAPCAPGISLTGP